MNPEEIVKAAPEIVKGLAAVGAVIPFTAMMKRILGPAADELAEMWKDSMRFYRYERQMKCVKKAEKMAEEAGFIPKAVPPKILFPLLEGVSLEEDDNLHTMWSALLANASYLDGMKVRPGYVALLRQMASDEAHLLNWMYEEWLKDGRGGEFEEREIQAKFSVYLNCGPFPKEVPARDVPDQIIAKAFRDCLGNLRAWQLVEEAPSRKDQVERYSLSQRGVDFVFVCRPPLPESSRPSFVMKLGKICDFW